MKYYLKIFLLSVAIGIVDILIYLFFLQFQIIHNSSYVPQELFVIVLILSAIPIHFVILFLVSFLFKRNRKALKITSALLILICIFALWGTSGEERARYSNEMAYAKTEKYNYQQGIATPEGYPIQLLSESRFAISVKGDRNPVTLLETGKVYSNQWGVGQSTFKSSDDGDIVLPDSLNLYWYSFLEDKYYALNTAVDKAMLSNFFKKGFRHDINGTLEETIQGKYDELIAGIAPGGDVVLWISSFNDTREIAVFKAEEINRTTLKDYDVVREDVRKEVLNDTCSCEDNRQFRRIVNHNSPIPFGIWTGKYRSKFNWKVEITDFGQTKMGLKFGFFNGERYQLFNEAIIQQTLEQRPLPEYLLLTFFKDGKKYNAYLEFDEQELYNTFKLLAYDPNESLILRVSISSDLKQTSVTLQAKGKSLSLENMKAVEIYAK
ncbi:Protein of unknown function [Sphingobacterium nematocida]|uniref:DUF2931 family protein n=1 Tax=Sphingobacterium nematocida TaxID=1513896 RepID=A0A1T5CLT8_9SPHI|nr:DUF2931 family protein [Sphingobacterium nematocida]SKB60354.1 Protein of unknown function [Sphingobacterium nematocida]